MAVDLLNGLVSHWSLDEPSGVRFDSHGSNDLTDNNTVGSAVGKIGNAASFVQANSENLTVASNGTLNPTLSDFTFCGWSKANTLPDFSMVLSKSTGSAAYEMFAIDADELNWRVSTGGSSFNAIGIYPGVGVWFFWEASRVGTNVLLRINNGAPVSVSMPQTEVESVLPFAIGSRTNNSLYWDGLIDSVSLWSRGLTEEERTALYNDGNGLAYEDFVPTPGTLARNGRRMSIGIGIGI